MKIRIRKDDGLWKITYPDLWEDWLLTFDGARMKAWDYQRSYHGKRR